MHCDGFLTVPSQYEEELGWSPVQTGWELQPEVHPWGSGAIQLYSELEEENLFLLVFKWMVFKSY